ncbi:MAG: CBS domain-containing protein [Phycisphaerae bacterium]|nr:CBS domain-containing protein [Phycisphaerae bacterium]
MNVGTIMTRQVVTVGLDETLNTVREMFESLRFHHLVVVEGKRVVGIVSDRDLFKNLSPFIGKISEQNRDLCTLQKKVHQVMTRKLITTTPEMSLAEAGRLLMLHRLNCLPVLGPQGECLGVLTLRDMLGWCIVKCAGGPDHCQIDAA